MSPRSQVATPKRRTRSPHPGVVLIRPRGSGAGLHARWRARWRDPDSGRLVWKTLDPKALRTAEARRNWAVGKSTALAKRRMELEAGAPRATGTALPDAIRKYFDDHPHLRPKTLEVYRSAASKFLAWAARAGIRTADEVTRARLVAFKAELLKERKRTHYKGSKRGQHKETQGPRSPHTINRELRSIGTILNYLRKLDLLPRLTSDDLRDGLAKLRTQSERIDYRKPKELQKLLEATLRHDAETFDETRAEHAGHGKAGSTPRYTTIAPFVACVMLTGMRFSEALNLNWKQVDLEALDNQGNTVGEIHLAGSGVKTGTARVVGLEVSPALRRLLAVLRLKTGGKGSVFGLTRGEATAAQRRLEAEYGAPEGSGWQALRRTAGVFMTNSPGLFGAAAAFRSAKQLGHSVQVAERHYVDVMRGIPHDARTVEAAMQIENQLVRIIAAVGEQPTTARKRRESG